MEPEDHTPQRMMGFRFHGTDEWVDLPLEEALRREKADEGIAYYEHAYLDDDEDRDDDFACWHDLDGNLVKGTHGEYARLFKAGLAQ